MVAKSVVIQGVEDVRVLEETVDPQAMAPGQCLIETDVSLISAGTELSRVFGLKKGAAYPVRPGYCAVGRVLAAGGDVTAAAAGDRVLFSGPHSSLQLYDQAKSDGGVLFRLREETRPVDGALLMMCWIAMNGVLPADVKLGDTAAILGLGTLGLVTSVYYRQMGVGVIALDPVKHRADIARELGIGQVIHCDPKDQYQAVMDLTGGKGADIVVDAAGVSQSVETGIKIAARYGQVILLGSPRTEYTANLTDTFNAIHTKMLTVIGGFNRRYPYAEKEGSRLSMVRSLGYIEGLLNQKILNGDLLISHVISPTQEALMDAYRGLMYRRDTYTGVIIDWR